jgi:hypothetical protein
MPSQLDHFFTRFLWISVVMSQLIQACMMTPAVWAASPAVPGFPQGLTPPQSFPAYTEPDLNSTYSGVPDQPFAPPTLKRPVMKDAFHCERTFLYKGKTYGCDSYVQRDAERLRIFVSDIPEATSEIDTYQRNRKNVRTAAYVGSVGLLIAIAGFFGSRAFQDGDGNVNSTGIAIRTVTTTVGMGLTLGSVTFGIISLNNNESHIDRAVALHNEAHPMTPIVLQFSKGFSL